VRTGLILAALALILLLHPWPTISGQEQLTIPYLPETTPRIDGAIGQDEYPSLYEDTDTGLLVGLAHNGTTLYVVVQSPGTGWVGVGFGSATMDRANLVVGYVDDRTGETYIFDETGVGHTHQPDVELGGADDILKYSGAQSEGKTTLEFAIPLSSGDPLDGEIRPGELLTVLVAYHPTEDDLSAYHLNKYAILNARVEPVSAIETRLQLSIEWPVVKVGELVVARARLTTMAGKPVTNATIELYSTTTFQDAGLVKVGWGRTDARGMAEIPVVFQAPGNFTLVGVYEGGAGSPSYAPSESPKEQLRVLYRGGQPIQPKDPFYNWSWYMLGLPHQEHGATRRVLDLGVLVVMGPLVAIVLGVWTVYGYVYYQLLRVRGEGEEEKG
jgi:hypothetical protein